MNTRIEKATAKYIEHLENGIEMEVNKLNHKNLLELHDFLIKDAFGAAAEFPHEKEDINFVKRKIVAALQNRYDSGGLIKEIENQKEKAYENNPNSQLAAQLDDIQKLLSDNTKLGLVLHKHQIIEGAQLKIANSGKKNNDRENDFVNHLKENKKSINDAQGQWI